MDDADKLRCNSSDIYEVVAHTSSLPALRSVISLADRNNTAESLKLVKLVIDYLMRTCSIDVGEMAKTPQKYIDPSAASGRPRAVCVPWETLRRPCALHHTTNYYSCRTIFELTIYI